MDRGNRLPGKWFVYHVVFGRAGVRGKLLYFGFHWKRRRRDGHLCKWTRAGSRRWASFSSSRRMAAPMENRRKGSWIHDIFCIHKHSFPVLQYCIPIVAGEFSVPRGHVFCPVRSIKSGPTTACIKYKCILLLILLSLPSLLMFHIYAISTYLYYVIHTVYITVTAYDFMWWVLKNKKLYVISQSRRRILRSDFLASLIVLDTPINIYIFLFRCI